ncbi:retrovirus-related pol polyprotein from transposon TNT 1-94 [Tanacetum coccineum]
MGSKSNATSLVIHINGEIMQQFKKGLSDVTIVKDKGIWYGNALMQRGQGTQHDPGVEESQDTQTTMIRNATFQTDDLDAFDIDCDEAQGAKAVLMANLSSYNWDVISEVPISDTNQDNPIFDNCVQEMYYSEQPTFDPASDIQITSDSNIISYVQYLKETESAAVQDTTSTEQQNAVIMSVFDEITNLITKCNVESIKNKNVQESLTVKLERYKEKAQRIKPTLYDGIVISKKHDVLSVVDFEETLILADKSQSKMIAKQNDPISKEKKSHCISLELKLQKNNEGFQHNKDNDNSNAHALNEFFIINDLKGRLQAKESSISKLRAHIVTLKGKNVSDNNVPVINASVIALGMFRITPAASGNKKNKTVKVHPRKVMSSSNKSYYVSMCNANFKHAVKDANSKFVCSTCNGCLFSTNHDKCVVAYINDVNKRVKSKSGKSKKMEWKPTRKVFTSVGHRWLPTGRTFTINGTKCPMTRITSNPIVPLKETSQTPVITPNLEIKVYRRRTKVANSVSFSDEPSILGPRPSNIMEPNRHWGSTVSNSPSSSRVHYSTVKFGNDQIAKIMGYGDYKIRNVTIYRVYYVEGPGNGIEFVNQALKSYYEDVRISHQTLVARTPQQHDVVKRRNRTLVEAERTMTQEESSSINTLCSPTKNDWDFMFPPMFDEYFNPPPSIVSPVPADAALRPVDLTGTSLSTSVEQVAPATSTSSTT